MAADPNKPMFPCPRIRDGNFSYNYVYDYYILYVDRVAAYFGLEHNVDPVDKMCVVVQKGPNTRL